MENAADCMYGSVMMKEDKDQYIANFLNTMDQDFLSKFHHKMNCSTSSSSSTDSNEMFEEPKLKNMKLKAVQSEETNMVRINLLQGDPNQNFRFQMSVALSVCISNPILVKQKCVWEAVVFYEFQLIFYNCKLWMPKMT